MTFSKTFPKTVPGSNYPVWEEIYLTEQEERDVEEQCRKENYVLMDISLNQAKALAIKHGINEDGIRATLAVALFEKQASHVIFHKENYAKEKWDKKNS
ncbi:hypothetical protein HYV86_06225 [Candidatus Woesearchaeota archaeon]|nr:hypothetical protein [Candidatus Woesearchaeota archaeon]